MPLTSQGGPGNGIHGGTSPIDYGGIPPTFGPFPGVSPYMNSYMQHMNQDGLWFQRSNRLPPRYFANVDYSKVTTRKLKGLVGSPHARSYHEMVGGSDEFLYFNYYNPRDASDTDHAEGNGIHFEGGWWNPDDSGFVVDFLWTGRATAVYDAREFVFRNFGDFTAQNEWALGQGAIPLGGEIQPVWQRDETVLLRALLSPPDFELTEIGDLDPELLFQKHLLNLAGIPVDDGTFEGVTIPWDLGFQLRYHSESIATNATMVFAPIIRSDSWKVRPTLGGRYLYTDNQFQFYGLDSGTIYGGDGDDGEGTPNLKSHPIGDGIDDDEDGIVDNAGSDDEGGGGAFNQINFNTDFSTIINSFVINQVESQLAGPEIGLRYDLGRNNGCRLWGHTKLAVMVNQERVRLTGDNIGLGTDIVPGSFDMPTRPNSTADPASFFIPTAANPNPNRFSDSKTDTHLSPLFEQKLQAEIPLFGSIPLLRDCRLLEHATFRVGATFTWINNMASPSQSIVWQGHPQRGLFPKININRQAWWLLTTDFGLGWTY